jgi:hypothetical protein
MQDKFDPELLLQKGLLKYLQSLLASKDPHVCLAAAERIVEEQKRLNEMQASKEPVPA